MHRPFALLLAAAGLAAPAAAQTVSDPNVTVSAVLPNGSFNGPTQIRFIGPSDFLITEKNPGRVRRVQGGVVSATIVLDLNVANANEQGLLGMELHPDFPTTPFVYLYYTSTTGGDGGPWLDNRLSRFTWNGSTLGSEVVLKTFASAADGMASAAQHVAGPILFGPGDLLYGTTGDLTRDFAEQNNQSQAGVSSLMGGIYRLNADGSIPPTNPFASDANSNFHAWFAYGVRNTYGIAIDPLTGNLWDTENGAGNYDEINLISAGTNSGWNEIQGPVARDLQGTATLVQLPGSAYSDPEFSWMVPVAPTGLVFLANSQFDADYRDALLVGDAKSGLWLFRLDAGRTGFVLTGGLGDLVADDLAEQDQVRFGQNFGTVTDLQVDPYGAVYVTSHDRGTVYRLPEPSFAIAMLAGSLAVAVAARARGVRDA